ncbi:ABC-F type ribosomal protection protein [Rossellomorea vietnamensis]|uniref:ABC-F type ribosomal protection protein n=1 Tax=Rossellomorea vietnamensis TaxID=218284 RepID=A0A5D4NNG5_9BACI|nr:ABC-F type ribosomal protection protein [Rossellomorea vietnamensis]TYS15038.1 ABC-F type ribosomal protection protein [Rossellomorea vietnamensis]
MIMNSVQQISKMYGGNLVFENLSFEVHEGDRIGFVGRNGTGKTTVFKLIAGVEQPDTGEIHFKKGARIGYLSQIPQYEDSVTGNEVLKSAFSELLNIEIRLKELEGKMGTEQDAGKLQRLLEEYGPLQDSFTLGGGYEIESEVAKVANGLEITGLLHKPFNALSGGEQTKVCLGLILLKNPDLLLLDEPTNHLDIGAVEWLEGFLKEYSGSVIVISHDRYFLDETINKVIELEDGEVRLYHTNYSQFVKEKEDRLLLEFQQYQEQQKKIKKMREAIKRLKEWANQATPPNADLHKRARNMERALERMEKLKRPVLDRKKMGLEFENGDRSGKMVFTMKEAGKSFNDKSLFKDASLDVHFKDRTALVGKNGTGKSTIIKMLLGEMEQDEGEVRLGSNVRTGYLSQHFTAADPNLRLIDAFRDEVTVTEGEARHILAGFLFYGAAVFRKVGQLSGGEKMRLRLAQLMHQDINFLVLDEPTNHLDIDSREVLEDALESFNGTILAVSHDRYFLNKLFEKTYWIHDRKLYFFSGNYSYAKEKLNEFTVEEEPVSRTKEGTGKEKQVKREKEKPSVSLDALEEELLVIEAEITSIDQQLSKETDLEILQKLYAEKELKERERDDKYSLLEQLL